ncbi:MAG: RNA-directed DNA polymerase [Planctomycetes bacterium]|nr:RNA-directed DNA polymerase [Planctomycetota bacterium]
MLNIQQVKHLAHRLGVSVKHLEEVAESPEGYCEELVLLDPAKPEKPRDVLDVRGPLRKMQLQLLREVLLPKLPISAHSHGGVRGRHIKSNVTPHLDSTFVFGTDISDFYPGIKHNRVYRLFTQQFGCAPDVARICTKLCTYQYHLALGLITSPILADQVMGPIDERIGTACRKAKLVYTRYVDDLTISGPFDLHENKSGIAGLVQRILNDHGFATNPSKNSFGRLADGVPITKIRVKRGHLDVRGEYVKELERQLADAASLANGGDFDGPYYTESQIRGRVQFVCWVNPGRKRELMRHFHVVPWDKVGQEAVRRGLVATKKVLMKRT